MDRLPKQDRQEQIIRRLTNDVAVRISTLAGEFNVTTETIRRDLDELSEKGLLSRTYGGAAVRSVGTEPSVQLRARENVEERQRIAEFAVEEVRAGDVLMIDAGSTTTFFASALARRPLELTVVTNSLGVARTLGHAEPIAVVLCPGDLRLTEEGVFGAETLGFLDRYHADLAIIGAGGVTALEVTDADPQAAAVKRKMMSRAARTMLLLDHNKFGQTQFATVCATRDIGIVVTDQQPEGLLAEQCRELRIAAGPWKDAAA